jgi:hypothetical protein
MPTTESVQRVTWRFGNLFCYRLFETNTDIRTLFAGIKHLKTAADLRNSKLLEAHAMKVICTIDDAITNLDDMDYVIKMLQMSAQAHYARQPGFDPNYFWVWHQDVQYLQSSRHYHLH